MHRQNSPVFKDKWGPQMIRFVLLLVLWIFFIEYHFKVQMFAVFEFSKAPFFNERKIY